MKDFLTIKPGVGLGDFKFGLSFESIKSLFGEPSEKGVADDGDVEWTYSGLDLVVYFSKDDEYRLNLIETRNTKATLWGGNIINLPREEMLDLFENQGIKSPEISDCNTGEFLFYYDECGCNVYCEFEKVQSVQMSALFDKDGDNYLWPVD